MKRSLTLLPIFLVLATLSGCGSNYNKRELALDETLTTMQELAAVLDTVNDEPSAKAAAPKIEQIADRLQNLAEQFESLPTLTKAEHDKLEAQFNDQFDALREQFAPNKERLSKLYKTTSQDESALKKAMERLQIAQENIHKAAKRLQAS
jgi:DNA repair exonuclease SbcCD ATPase subunit